MAVIIEKREADDKFLGKTWEARKRCWHCKSLVLINHTDIIRIPCWDGECFCWDCPACGSKNEPWFLWPWIKEYAREVDNWRRKLRATFG